MWPFAKKKLQTIDLPPLPSEKPTKEEIELIPEEGESMLPLPDAPKTIVKSEGPLFPQMPEAEIPEEVPQIKQSSVVFLKSDAHSNISSAVNEIVNDFDNMEFEISRVSDLKESRYTRIDNLQKTLEEVSKNLMNIDDTIFGG